jgi:hypothetical protein
MKPIRALLLLLTAVLLCLLPQPARAATYTVGTNTLTVTFSDLSGGYSARVDAFWVTDAAGNFVQNIRKDAGTRQGYLYQWAAARKTTAIDGYSGATISSWTPVTVTWDGRDTNNVVVPDGSYKLYVEFTDRNGQGPYTTNGLTFYKGLTNVSVSYPNQTYLTSMSLNYVPTLAYDIAVTGISPSAALTNVLVPVLTTITNKTSVPGTFTLTLSNATTGVLIGSQAVSNLAGNATTNITINWNTAGLALGGYSIVARASAVLNETSLADNVFSKTITLTPPTHDVAVAAITAPTTVTTGLRTNISVTLTNKGGSLESFAVTLTDETDGKTVGTNQVSSLAAMTGTTTTFAWSTTNASWGIHTLRARAATVAGETSTADNTLTALVTVSPPMTTNTYVTKSNYWRYHAQGVDLGTTWRLTNYNDSAWPLGRGPLGYGDAPLSTTLGYGSDANNKYLTYYFRTPFNLTSLPTTLTMRLRRDDGAVVYFNGSEVYRTNLPTGTISYSTLALAAVSSPDETAYFEYSLPVTNLNLGTNWVAVEVHQNAANSSDLSFDLELLGTVPPVVPVHDIAIVSITAPAQALPGVATNLTVVVTNRGQFTETFPVVLRDDTTGIVIGTNQLSNLLSSGSVGTTFAWLPPAAPWANHTLRAVAGPVTSETSLNDNTNSILVFVAPRLETNVLIARSNFWRYSDAGADLTYAPWKALDYFDSAWAAGQAPFGYGDPVATAISYGPSATAKHPTYYFRTTFNLDVPPTWLRLRLRADDGAVVYHNGVEIHRLNLTNNPVTYSSWATAAVDGAYEQAYVESDVALANVVIGPNELAVEVHQVSATNDDLVFDAELLAINPVTTRTNDLAVTAIEPAADALVGDLLRIAVTVTNRGNVSGTFTVYLRDTNSNQIVASAVITNLAVGTSTTVNLEWTTAGASPGSHSLAAFTVLNGVTNAATVGPAQALLTGTGFGLRATGLTGALGGRCAAVATVGNLLLVGAGATLEVWDCSQPTALVKLGQVRLPGQVESIATRGSFAFAACGSAGVQFVDLSQPAAPAHVNTFDSSGHAYGLAVSGDLLLVADGVSGLRILNVATPATPSLAGSYFTAGPARAVAVVGTRAYLVDSHQGLLVLDLANPAAPTQLGSHPFHAGQAVAVAGGFAYVVDANNHFLAINVSSPATPTLASSLLLPNVVGQGVVLNGSTAYVPALDAGLLALDIANPAAMTLARTVPVPAPGQSVGVALASNTLYVANGLAGFQVLDATAASDPVLQADWPVAARACEVAVNGGLACLGAGENGLRLYNVSNPASPVWVGWLTNALNARCVALGGSVAVVGDGQFGLKVVSVTNAAAPLLLGSWGGTNLASLRNVGLSGTQAIASDGRTVGLFEVSNASNPTLVATYAAPAFVFDLAVAGNRAYLACGNAGMVVLEIGASSLTLVGSYDSPGFATGVSVSGPTAYLADGPAGWSILDVTGATPTLVRASATEGPVADIAVAGVLATLGNGLNLAAGMDVSTPLAPVPKQSFNALVRALSLTASGGLVFAAEDEAGLAIGTVSTDVDKDGLPDAWEQQIVDADPNDQLQSIADVLPTGDYDGDGNSNYAEFVAGTSPTDAGSRFIASVPPTSGGASPTIRWSSVAGKTYTLHKSTNLQAGFTVLADNLPATPPLNSFTDPNPGAAAFYIISVR